MQTVTAQDSSHLISANAGTPQALSSANTFSLGLIDQAVETATTLGQTNGTGTVGTDVPIRPISIGGDDYWVMFLHDFQVKDMRTSTTTGQWLDIQKSALQGGEGRDTPIFNGALGVYNRVVLHQASRLPLSNNSSTGVGVASTRRALFCGAQAGLMAFGRDNGPDAMTWTEELFDYQNQLGVSAGLIGGLKRTIFNSASFGVIGVDTWAASGAT